MGPRQVAFLDSIDVEKIRGGGEVYFRRADMKYVLEQANRGDLAVLGFDGFEREGEKRRARLDWIADFSGGDRSNWESYREKLLQLALRVLEEIPESDKIVFCVTWTER